MPTRCFDRGQNVKTHRVFVIRGVKVDHLIRSPRWNVIQNVVDQAAVGINHSDTCPGLDVLENEIAKQRGLTCSRLPDDMKMLSPIGGGEAEVLLSLPNLAHAQNNDPAVVVLWL